MFDIGFWELAVIGVVALLVVGPERLPALARTVGLWVGRARRFVQQVKDDVDSELHAQELKDLLEKPEGVDEVYDILDETKGDLNKAAQDLKSDFDSAADAVESANTPFENLTPDSATPTTPETDTTAVSEPDKQKLD